MHKAPLASRHGSSSLLAQHLPLTYPVLLPLSTSDIHAAMFALSKNPNFVSSFLELANGQSPSFHAAFLTQDIKSPGNSEWLSLPIVPPLHTKNAADRWNVCSLTNLRTHTSCPRLLSGTFMSVRPTYCPKRKVTTRIFLLSQTKKYKGHVCAFFAGLTIRTRLIIRNEVCTRLCRSLHKNGTSIVPMCCSFPRLCCHDYISSRTKTYAA